MSLVAVAVGLTGGRWHRNRYRSPNSDLNLRDNSRKDERRRSRSRSTLLKEDALKMLLEVKNFTEEQDRQEARQELRDLKTKTLWDGILAKRLKWSSTVV